MGVLVPSGRASGEAVGASGLVGGEAAGGSGLTVSTGAAFGFVSFATPGRNTAPALPDGWTAGEYAVLLVMNSGGSTCMASAGWTRVFNGGSDSSPTIEAATYMGLFVFTRFLEGGDSAPTLTMTAGNYETVTLTYSGVNASTPIDVQSDASTISSLGESNGTNEPKLPLTMAGDSGIMIQALAKDTAVDIGYGNGTGYNDRALVTNTSGADTALAVQDLDVTGPGSVPTDGNWQNGNSYHMRFAMVLAPA